PQAALDQVRGWPELKLEILRGYGSAYSRIMSRQPGLAHYYIEGFAGPDFAATRPADGFVAGNARNALLVTPPFRHHYFVDLDGGRVEALRPLVADRIDVTLRDAGGNGALLRDIFPRVRYEDYRRALCVLDPCGLRLDWDVVEKAGRLRTLDLFLCLPVEDESRAPLWTRARRVAAAPPERMDPLGGDDAWRAMADRPAAGDSAAGRAARSHSSGGQSSADAVAQAFRRRLREEAGFANVPDPLPLRNGANAVASYLFFASAGNTAND